MILRSTPEHQKSLVFAVQLAPLTARGVAQDSRDQGSMLFTTHVVMSVLGACVSDTLQTRYRPRAAH